MPNFNLSRRAQIATRKQWAIRQTQGGFFADGKAQALFAGRLGDVRIDGVMLRDWSTDGDLRDQQPGRAAAFDGTSNAYVQCPTNLITTGDFTISFWCNVTNHLSHRGLFGMGDPYSTAGTGVAAILRDDGRVFLKINDGSPGSGLTLYPTWEPPLATWVPMTFRADRDGDLEFYASGELRGSLDISSVQATLANGNFNIGRYSGSLTCLGKMFDFRLYNGVLGLDEILAFHNGDYLAQTIPTWWKLDSNGTVKAWECSGNGHHGTRQSGVTEYTGNDVPYSFQNLVGFTNTAGELIPRNESNHLLDADDLPLGFKDRCPRDAELSLNLPTDSLYLPSSYAGTINFNVEPQAPWTRGRVLETEYSFGAGRDAPNFVTQQPTLEKEFYSE